MSVPTASPAAPRTFIVSGLAKDSGERTPLMTTTRLPSSSASRLPGGNAPTRLAKSCSRRSSYSPPRAAHMPARACGAGKSAPPGRMRVSVSKSSAMCTMRAKSEGLRGSSARQWCSMHTCMRRTRAS